MRLKIRKIIKDIKAGRFGQTVLSQFPDPDPGDRRRARMCLCIR